jgi:protein TonB
MSKAHRPVLTYLAAFSAAVVLHAGLAAGLRELSSSGGERVAAFEPSSQQDALVVSFFQPQPAQMPLETTEPIIHFHEPPPTPALQPSPEVENPIPEPSADTPSEPTAAVQAPESPMPEQPVQSAAQPSPVHQHSKAKKQVYASVKIEKPRPLQPIDAEAVYPLGSRLRGEEGAVQLVVRIGADGRIDDLQIRESSGFTALDKAALRALRRTRFAPATRNDQAVPGELSILIRFALDS